VNPSRVGGGGDICGFGVGCRANALREMSRFGGLKVMSAAPKIPANLLKGPKAAKFGRDPRAGRWLIISSSISSSGLGTSRLPLKCDRSSSGESAVKSITFSARPTKVPSVRAS
jgi:hypothetical protein